MHAATYEVPPSRPMLMRLLVRPREYRHPNVWMSVRTACGVWNLVLAVLFLANGQTLGSLAWLGLLPLAGAALIFWTAYDLRRGTRG